MEMEKARYKIGTMENMWSLGGGGGRERQGGTQAALS